MIFKHSYLDRFLVLLVLLLAFFLGSFAARNSDLWMHLATGRLIVEGKYTFGADPFAYTSGDTRWVNTSWLADVLGYGLTAALGGPESARGGAALVIAKALLIVALAGVMLGIRRPGQGQWVLALCVALSLLVMSPRLLLQPACFSFLFLGLILYLLTRSDSGNGTEGDKLRLLTLPARLFVIPFLFVLWVNLDGWFVLGLLVFGLFLLGEMLQSLIGPGRGGPDMPSAQERRHRGLIFLACIGACLVNPYHVHAFTLPPDLATALSSSPLIGDSWFRPFFQSPLDGDYFYDSASGYKLAGFTYAALVVLGLFSFAVNYAGWRWWRFLVWVAFFLLSAYLARAVPFFAVVAGPISVLNFQDFSVRVRGAEPRAGRAGQAWALLGRGGALVGLAVLLFLAWPGWLHPSSDNPNRTRHVAWTVQVDPSLRGAAEKLCALRRQGVLRADSFGFNYLPDNADYCAWFCPEEKGFYDTRYHLYNPEVTSTYLDMRRTLASEKRLTERPAEILGSKNDSRNEDRAWAPPRSAPDTWQEVFRDKNRPIDHVILTDTPSAYLLMKLWLDTEQWTLLYMDGRTTIFGWKDPRGRTDNFGSRVFDPNPRAFGPDLPAAERVPREVPELPRPREPWDEYVHGVSARPLEVDASIVYMDYFTAREIWQDRIYLRANVASAVGGLSNGANLTAMARAFSYTVCTGIRPKSPQAPIAALPILAVRNARRAVAKNPANADAQLTLARALLLLGKYQRELWIGPSPGLDELREVQVVAALQQALLLNPRSAMTHQLLAETYENMNRNDPRFPTHLDLALEHWGQWSQRMREKGPRPGETPDIFEKHISSVEKNFTKRLAFAVAFKRKNRQIRPDAVKFEDLNDPNMVLQRLLADFDIQAANKPPSFQYDLALRHGLAKRALEALAEADPSSLGRDQRTQFLLAKLSLQLKSGQLEEVLPVPPEMNEWFHILAAAARGDHAGADAFFSQVLDKLESERAGLAEHCRWDRKMEALMIQTPRFLMTRGLLALEGGDTARAAECFRRTLRQTHPVRHCAATATLFAARSPLEELLFLNAGAGVGYVSPSDFYPLARHYLDRIEAAGARPGPD